MINNIVVVSACMAMKRSVNCVQNVEKGSYYLISSNVPKLALERSFITNKAEANFAAFIYYSQKLICTKETTLFIKQVVNL